MDALSAEERHSCKNRHLLRAPVYSRRPSAAGTAERPEPEAGTDDSRSCVPEPLQLGTLRSHMRLVVGRRGGQA